MIKGAWKQIQAEGQQRAHTPFTSKGCDVLNSFGVKVATCLDPGIATFIAESVNDAASFGERCPKPNL